MWWRVAVIGLLSLGLMGVWHMDVANSNDSGNLVGLFMAASSVQVFHAGLYATIASIIGLALLGARYPPRR